MLLQAQPTQAGTKKAVTGRAERSLGIYPGRY
jgi:hypothetical protein